MEQEQNTEQQNTEQQNSSSFAVEPNPQKNKASAVAVAIVLIIVIFGIWHWLGGKNTTQKIPSTEPTQTENTPSELQNATSSTSTSEEWKTYRDEQYGFEFKYPSSWGNFIISGYYPSQQEIKFPSGGGFVSIEPLFAKIENYYLTKYEEKFTNSNGVEFLFGTRSIRERSYKRFYLWNVFKNIDGKGVAIILDINHDPTPDFAKDRDAWLAERIPEYPDFRKLIDSLIVLPTALPDISKWQFHRNEQYGFQVEHPKDWKISDVSLISPNDGKKWPIINITSPVRYDLPGYENIPVEYRMTIHAMEGNPTSLNQIGVVEDFGSPDERFGKQSPWNISVDKDVKEATKEYKIGKLIFSSFKLIP